MAAGPHQTAHGVDAAAPGRGACARQSGAARSLCCEHAARQHAQGAASVGVHLRCSGCQVLGLGVCTCIAHHPRPASAHRERGVLGLPRAWSARDRVVASRVFVGGWDAAESCRQGGCQCKDQITQVHYSRACPTHIRVTRACLQIQKNSLDDQIHQFIKLIVTEALRPGSAIKTCVNCWLTPLPSTPAGWMG